MLDTRTRLHAAMPADRSASSNDVSFSRCLPTPFVKNTSFGTNPATSPLLVAGENWILNSTVPGVKERRRRVPARCGTIEGTAAARHELQPLPQRPISGY